MANRPKFPTPTPPVFQGGPEPTEKQEAIHALIGHVTKLTGRIYITTQGDMWDLISLRVYGMKRRDDHLLHHLLIQANYPLRNVCRFPGGIAVNIPNLPVKTEIPLVPWKKAQRIP